MNFEKNEEVGVVNVLGGKLFGDEGKGERRDMPLRDGSWKRG